MSLLLANKMCIGGCSDWKLKDVLRNKTSTLFLSTGNYPFLNISQIWVKMVCIRIISGSPIEGEFKSKNSEIVRIL